MEPNDHYGFTWYAGSVVKFSSGSAVNYYSVGTIPADGGTVAYSTTLGDRRYALNVLYCDRS